ncbi:MAG: O-antigen ligase family protein [Gloeotrichia echinulata GP01]
MKIEKHLWHKIEAVLVVILVVYTMDLSVSPLRNFILNLGVIILSSFHWKRIAYVITKDKTLILLVGLACFSVFWSEFPNDTFAKIQLLARTTIFGAYLAARYTVKDQMRILTWAIIVAGILSIVVCIFIPSYGIASTNNESVWMGIFTHKQLLARTMAVGFSLVIVYIVSKDNKPWVNLSLLVIPVSLIMLSNSKSGLILVLISIGILSIYKIAKQQSLSRLILALIMVLFTASIVFIVIDNLEFIIVDLLHKDLELNGRTPIWTLALQKIKERYWLGYGYSAFWQSHAGSYVINNTWLGLGELDPNVNPSPGTWRSHNGYIEMMAQLGIIGLAISIIHMLLLFDKTIKLLISTLTIQSLWMLEFLVFIIVNNMSGTMTFLSDNIFWLIHVAVSISCCLEYSKMKINININK